ncbi:hypothetical protein DRO54_02770 [Candidatus Bathyarchaeota archaeon]|nr:MAG: hypothetical protein DRO54_02770 [Candidatus Bathyarchaeota archaeon]
MKGLRKLKNCRRAVSYAISAVIIAATTIVLVIVALSYAYQTIDQQQGASEYNVIENSFLTLDDALNTVAWKPQSSRSIRFSVNYGELWLLKDERLISINVTINGAPIGTPFQIQSGEIKYSISHNYIRFSENYKEFFIGSNLTVTNSSTVGFGRAYVADTGGKVDLVYYPAVRAMKTSVIQVKEGGESYNVTYVDIWIIKLSIEKTSVFRGDFDIKLRCLSVETLQSLNYAVSEGDTCTVSVQIEDEASEVNIPINHDGQLVVNFIVSDIEVTI